jgi:hypothetical protein
MIRITPQHIYALRDSTGKPFTDLLDRLIRSSAAILGIPPSDVLDNPRINYRDGGVDTQVNKGGHRGPWDYFKGPTTWQYKAVELEGLTDSKVRNEISGNSKDYVRSLLKDGYAYRLCVAHDGPAEKRNSIKASLDAEIKKVRLDAPESSVLLASDIVAWVNAFPAIAAEMLDSSMTEFSSWFAGMHSGGAFAGSIADHMEQRATRAEPFLNFPIEAVRRWALAEIKYAEQNAESFRMSEEELF